MFVFLNPVGRDSGVKLVDLKLGSQDTLKSRALTHIHVHSPSSQPTLSGTSCLPLPRGNSRATVTLTGFWWPHNAPMRSPQR